MDKKVFNIFSINKKTVKKNNDEYVVPLMVKNTSIVENVLTAEEPVLVQKIQLNYPKDLGDIHTN